MDVNKMNERNLISIVNESINQTIQDELSRVFAEPYGEFIEYAFSEAENIHDVVHDLEELNLELQKTLKSGSKTFAMEYGFTTLGLVQGFQQFLLDLKANPTEYFSAFQSVVDHQGVVEGIENEPSTNDLVQELNTKKKQLPRTPSEEQHQVKDDIVDLQNRIK